MAFGNHAEMGTQSASKIRPAATVDGNTSVRQSPKATRIKIGGHIHYDYPTESVMMSMRGDKHDPNLALPLNGRSQISMSETPKKGKFGNTDSVNHGIHSSPSL